jgi:hypothetical protein
MRLKLRLEPKAPLPAGFRKRLLRRYSPRNPGLALAVAVGFEPTEAINLTRFRVVLLRPLGHATDGDFTCRPARHENRVS